MSLDGIGLLLSLGPEVLLDPSLEFPHVGHDLCVLHAVFKVGDEGRPEEDICFADLVSPKEPLVAIKLSNGQILLGVPNSD